MEATVFRHQLENRAEKVSGWVPLPISTNQSLGDLVLGPPLPLSHREQTRYGAVSQSGRGRTAFVPAVAPQRHAASLWLISR